MRRRTPRRPTTLGERGERAAERHLRSRGYAIVARRERTPLGELDLVAVRGRVVAFVEVKTRGGEDHGAPEEAVDEAKQRRLQDAATAFLKRHDLLDCCTARFDIVAVVWPPGAPRPRSIRHLVDAFEFREDGEPF